MDKNIEIFDLVIDLIIYIQNNDIDNVKNNVNKINQLTSDSTTYLDDLFAMNNLLQHYNNTSLLYTIENLSQLNNKYLYKWTSSVNHLLQRNNSEEIITFIDEHIAPELGQIPQYKFRDLIKLSTLIENNNKLQELKALLQEGRII